jgi:hypothetical protein
LHFPLLRREQPQEQDRGDEADEANEKEEEEVGIAPPPVIDHIENMVLLFLKQLAMPGRADEDTDATDSSTDSDACDDENDKEKGTENINSRRKLKQADYKIEIPLADRRKRGRDGCAYTHIFLVILDSSFATS